MSKYLLFYFGIALPIFIYLLIIYQENQNETDFHGFIQQAQSLGYYAEELLVETKDGFILSIHRISSKKHHKIISSLHNDPILIGHCVGGSSDIFIRNSEENSLAYVLANQGFDVFMMNSRGNRYSSRHKYYSQNQYEYWDFSFAEMAELDLPAVASFIFNEIYNGKVLLNYIGHSQGGTILLASLSSGYVPKEYFKNIILISPAAIFSESGGSLSKNLLKKINVFEILRKMGMKQVIIWNKMSYYLTKFFPKVSQFILYISSESNSSPIDYTNFYKFLPVYPFGVSVKAFSHFAQLINSQKFQLFDNGQEENLKKYNSIHPPQYELSNIKNDIHIIAGLEDTAVHVKDLYALKNALINSKNATISIFEEGHCSFFSGTDNRFLLKIISLLQQDIDLSTIIK